MSTYVSVAGLRPEQSWGGVVVRHLHVESLIVGILDVEALFDHIAQVNADVVRWVQELLSGRPVELTREMITQRNADHARRTWAG